MRIADIVRRHYLL